MPKITKDQLQQIEDYLKTLPDSEREVKRKEIITQLEEPKQCPFCLMSEGKIDTTKVYEDKNFLAVLEIKPANKGHTIIIPKRHIGSLSQLNTEEAESLMGVIKKLVFDSTNSTQENTKFSNLNFVSKDLFLDTFFFTSRRGRKKVNEKKNARTEQKDSD